MGIKIIATIKQRIYIGMKVPRKANKNAGAGACPKSWTFRKFIASPMITTNIATTGTFPRILPGTLSGSTLKSLGKPIAILGIGNTAFTMVASTKPSNILIRSPIHKSFDAFPEKIIPPIDIAVASGIFITRLNTTKNLNDGFSTIVLSFTYDSF